VYGSCVDLPLEYVESIIRVHGTSHELHRQLEAKGTPQPDF
jgi:hypothetical protein